VRHIYSNFRKKFPEKNLKLLLWKAAYCTHPQAWEAVMREIKEVNVDAFKHLLAIPPRYVVLIPAVHCIYCELFLKSIFLSM